MHKECSGKEGDFLIEFYMIIPLFLWLFTIGVISVGDILIKRKLGIKSIEHLNLRLPKFIAIMLNSAISIGLILFIRFNTITPEKSTYFVVPYFGVMSYFITCVFREFKDARNSYR